MSKPLGIAAGILALGVAVLYGWWFFLRPAVDTPEALAAAALNAGTDRERERAAVTLCQLGKPGHEQLLRVLGESPQAAVRVACIRGLAEQWDYRSMPLLLEMLDNPSAPVRLQAGEAVQDLLRVNYFFHTVGADDQREPRQQVIQRLRARWEEFQHSSMAREFARQQMGEEL